MTSLVLLAAGGTGGHVFPAEALAAELALRGRRLVLVTDDRGGSYGGTLGDLETFRIRAGGIAGKGVVARARSVVALGVGLLQARRLMRQLRPNAAVGFGGYASVPTMLAATMAQVPSMIHEQNAILGRANRMLCGRVDRIANSFENARGIAASAQSKCVHTGMPVRAAVAAVRDTPYPPLDAEGPIRLLVTGGSQGARVFSDVVPAALARLDESLRQRIHVTQQCRPEDLERVRAAYAAAGTEAHLAKFLDDLPQRLAAAHLVIARAGASTVAELTTVGRPAILVPYPYAIDDHQTLNAHAIDEAGGGWLMPEDSFTAESLAKRLTSLLGLPEIVRTAATSAREVGRPDAAARLADVVDELLAGSNDDKRRQAA